MVQEHLIAGDSDLKKPDKKSLSMADKIKDIFLSNAFSSWVALLAFLFTLFSFYFDRVASYRTILVINQYLLSTDLQKDINHLVDSDKLTFTASLSFINSGNRPILVGKLFAITKKPGSSDCYFDNALDLKEVGVVDEFGVVGKKFVGIAVDAPGIKSFQIQVKDISGEHFRRNVEFCLLAMSYDSSGKLYEGVVNFGRMNTGGGRLDAAPDKVILID